MPGRVARAYDAFTAADLTDPASAARRDLRQAWEDGHTMRAGRGTVRVIELSDDLGPPFAALVETIAELRSRDGADSADKIAARAARALLARLAADGIIPGPGPRSGDDRPHRPAHRPDRSTPQP